MGTVRVRFEALRDGAITVEQFLDVELLGVEREFEGDYYTVEKLEDGTRIERWCPDGLLRSLIYGSVTERLFGELKALYKETITPEQFLDGPPTRGRLADVEGRGDEH